MMLSQWNKTEKQLQSRMNIVALARIRALAQVNARLAFYPDANREISVAFAAGANTMARSPATASACISNEALRWKFGPGASNSKEEYIEYHAKIQIKIKVSTQ